MNRIRNIRRLACVLAGLASTALAFGAPSPAALATVVPPAGGAGGPAAVPLRPEPPGWYKHPPLPDPSRIHAALPGGMPGWQIALIAAVAAVLAVTLTALLTRARAARRRAAAHPA